MEPQTLFHQAHYGALTFDARWVVIPSKLVSPEATSVRAAAAKGAYAILNPPGHIEGTTSKYKVTSISAIDTQNTA
ncbi:hypothetical protein OPV22_030661 [Ensete ventricosum]|uniref:Uncharacterized protein n=1 Tax=Ensete ventricosum TaxID=4639 RepID=A0AAV8QAG1_ENSVE|nr:hypothetical protein OPV22_030661 [Ensete ventricosum]